MDQSEKRILFVDDEPRVLAGLERMLFALGDLWEMEFVESGAEALEVLEQQAVDVIVTDMRMPGMDGATLLTEVQKRAPGVVRIILSGHTEMEAAMRAIPVAHQFLAKPSSATVVQEVIERACNLQSLISDQKLRDAIGMIDSLPTRPDVYSKLSALLANPECSVNQLASVVEADLGMCAKLMQLVNSAFIGLRQNITSIERAVSYVGAAMLKNLVLSVEVFRAFEGDDLAGLSLAGENEHALTVAAAARDILDHKTHGQDAFMAGVLHDVGKLVLASRDPQGYREAVRKSRENERPMFELENELFGVDHGVAGAYLLGIWGLPYPVVEAVAHHHQPWRVKQRDFDVLSAVFTAEHLVRRAHHATHEAGLDETYLEALGVVERLDSWRQIIAPFEDKKDNSS
jgi:HD-like signal output (HDOD) protein/CheY-like chemotaxis protein